MSRAKKRKVLEVNGLQSEIEKNIAPCGSIVISFEQKFIRFDIDKKNDKAGWLIGSTWTYDGQEYSSCFYGNWKSGEQFQWVSWDKDKEIEDIKFRQKMIKDQQKQKEIIDLQKRKENLDASEKAKKELSKMSPASTSHWYVQKKGLSNCDGLLTDLNLNLVIPTRSEKNKITGYQKITQKGKYFLKGQQVESSYFIVGNPDNSNLIYVAEGWATAETIRHITGKPCLVAFNCHNIGPAIESFSIDHSGKKYIIAADNDKNNIGKNSARKVARNSTNIKYIVPKFSSSNTSLTDFNDLFLSEGFDVTKKQLEKIRPDDFITVELLGFQETQFFFYSNRSHEVYSFNFSQIRDGQLASIASEEYWYSSYFEKHTKDGEPLGKCDWIKTSQKITEIQHNIGKFSQSKIRGFGSWRDNNSIVVNTGEHLFVDGKKRTFSDRSDLRFFYYPSVKKELDFETQVKTKFDPIVEALNLVDFESDSMRMAFIGFLVHACSFSADRWRTHIWLSAPHGTGKSTLMEFINRILINSRLFQDSTAAGIRQIAKHDSMVILADEAEAEVRTSKQLVALAKQASSGGESSIVRGSASNAGAIEYNPSLLFCFASIRKAEMTRAEMSRVIDIRLKKSDNFCPEINKKRQELLDQASCLGKDLFVHVNQNLDHIEQIKPRIKNLLAQKGFDSRSADTWSNLLAGFSFLTGLSALETVDLILDVETVEQVRDDVQNGDTEQFYDAMMGLLIRHNGEEITLSEIISNKNHSLLARYGIYLRDTSKYKGIVFVPNNLNLTRIFKAQTDFKNPYHQMDQDKCRFFKHLMSINSNKRRVYFLDVTLNN